MRAAGMSRAGGGDRTTFWSSRTVPSIPNGKSQGAKAKAEAANEAGAGDEAEASEGPGLFDGGTGAGSVAPE